MEMLIRFSQLIEFKSLKLDCISIKSHMKQMIDASPCFSFDSFENLIKNSFSSGNRTSARIEP